jgi:hypothetical protein
VLINDHQGGATVIGTPGQVTYMRGEGQFNGQDMSTHINHGANMDTYIRPGKIGGQVFINDHQGGATNIGGSIINMHSPINGLDVKHDLLFTGDNNWIVHTPNDGRHAMFISPSSAQGNKEWNWNHGLQIDANGELIIKGGGHASHFNHGADKHTFIRPGNDGSHVYLNDAGTRTGVVHSGTRLQVQGDRDFCIGGTCIDEDDLKMIRNYFRNDMNWLLHWESTRHQQHGHISQIGKSDRFRLIRFILLNAALGYNIYHPDGTVVSDYISYPNHLNKIHPWDNTAYRFGIKTGNYSSAIHDIILPPNHYIDFAHNAVVWNDLEAHRVYQNSRLSIVYRDLT